MAQRLDLHAVLEAIPGPVEVYYQPPPTIQLEYPCIVYKKDFAQSDFAGNKPYQHHKRYEVTVIDRNPDSGIPDLIAELPMCSFDRHYTADNLHHDVYNIFF